MAAQKYEISLRAYFTSECSEQVKYFFNVRREISYICKWPCNVLFIIKTPMKYQTISL